MPAKMCWLSRRDEVHGRVRCLAAGTSGQPPAIQPGTAHRKPQARAQQRHSTGDMHARGVCMQRHSTGAARAAAATCTARGGPHLHGSTLAWPQEVWSAYKRVCAQNMPASDIPAMQLWHGANGHWPPCHAMLHAMLHALAAPGACCPGRWTRSRCAPHPPGLPRSTAPGLARL